MMAHHAYFVTGELEEGIVLAEDFTKAELGLDAKGNPDVMTLRHGLLSVDDARRLRSLAELSPTAGGQKVLIISASRLFHEAQNALLKLFEEPPEGNLLLLVIPSEGMLLPTLRSRLLPLPSQQSEKNESSISAEAQNFLQASPAEREKFITKLLDRARSDKEDEKQSARLSAIHFIEGLTQDAYEKWRRETNQRKKEDLQLYLEDLNAFLPILHERSAPLKLIFEHIQLVHH